MSEDWIRYVKVGDKVVCIERGKWFNLDGSQYVGETPTYGNTYEVSEVYCAGAKVYFRLREFAYGRWYARRFRPVQPKQHDLSWAYDILKKASKPVEDVA